MLYEPKRKEKKKGKRKKETKMKQNIIYYNFVLTFSLQVYFNSATISKWKNELIKYKSIKKVVIPKTPEQIQRINASLRKNFLFRQLDEEQSEDLVNAMFEKKVDNGVDLIVQVTFDFFSFFSLKILFILYFIFDLWYFPFFS